MQGSLYIVDAFNYLYRAFFALPPLRTSRGVPTGAVYGLCQMLLRIEREHAPTHLVAAFDAPGKTFRDDLFSQYKAHRPPMPPELAEQIALVPRVIEAFGIATLTVPGVEADDIIATLVGLAVARGVRVVICSSDKDLLQLVGDDVSVLDAVKNRLLGRTDVIEKWGVPPERVADLLALVGDSVDNVPGVPGIGPKTAADLLGKFGTLDALLTRADEVKGKRGEALRASMDGVRLARRLVALKSDVVLPKDLAALSRVAPDRIALDALFRELEFSRLVSSEAPAPASKKDGTRADAAPSAPPPAAEARSTPESPRRMETVLVSDRASLDRLATTLAGASSIGIAYVLDHRDPLQASLSALGLATADACFQIPISAHGFGQGALAVEAHPGMPESEVLARLGAVLGNASIRKSIHNAKALEVLLATRGHTLAGVTTDPLLAAYLLDAERAPHDLAVVARDCALEPVADDAPDRVGANAAMALALAPILDRRLAEAGLAELYRDLELPLAHVLADVERRGIRLDTAFLRRQSQEVGGSIVALEHEIHALAGRVFNIGSPKQLAAVLFETLHLPVIRKNKTGPSTDADVLEQLAAEHAVPAKILEYRTLTKLKNTYLDALPGLVNSRTGRLHTTFNQAVAATGRLSSSDPNLQNIPIRTEVGRRIRHAFVADPGHVLLSADYSQIELRVLAHFSEDPAFVAAFASGEDIHQRTAAEVFGVPPTAVSAEQRRIAKAINFGLVFGQTDFGLAQALHIPRATAKAYIETYFARYAGVRAFMDRVIADARAKGEVRTLLGRKRRLPELASSRATVRAQGERMARNTPIQGTAADLLKMAMLRIARGLDRFPSAQLLLTVHDELVFEVDETRAANLAQWVKGEMEGVFRLHVPLVVEVRWGKTWGDAH